MQILFDYIYQINWFAVIVAAAVAMLINAAWYSRPLFGREWMKSAGLKKKDTTKPGVDLALVISFVTLIITAAAIAVLIDVLELRGAYNGMLLGVLAGFAFSVMNNGMHKLYEQRPFTLFLVTAVSDLLTVAAIGAILAVW